MLRHSENCVNLSGSFNDNISSVDAGGGCVVLCEHALCRGRCQQIDYFNSDLSRLGMNDIVSSIKSCTI